MRRPLALALLLAAVTTVASARADRAAALADFAEAERADKELRLADAMRLYQTSFADDPSAPGAPRARARAQDLADHAEGGFAPLARLEAVRRDPAQSNDPAAIAKLETDAAAFPPGRVRIEARMLAGVAWLGRLRNPARARGPFAAVVDDPAADRTTRSLALRHYTEACEATGNLAAARAAVLAHPGVAPVAASHVLRAYRRTFVRAAAIALLGVVLAAGLGSLAALARRGGVAALRSALRGTTFAVGAWVALAGVALVHAYDESDPRPFVWLGAGTLVLGTAARAWSLAGPTTRWHRALRVALCALAALALAFVALDRSDPMYLDSFGL